ncbi:MAG TPA: hypothetical protein DCR99_02400 [Thermus scotoductus]|nr:hypothetical protein [Thermus scotoductus]
MRFGLILSLGLVLIVGPAGGRV